MQLIIISSGSLWASKLFQFRSLRPSKTVVVKTLQIIHWFIIMHFFIYLSSLDSSTSRSENKEFGDGLTSWLLKSEMFSWSMFFSASSGDLYWSISLYSYWGFLEGWLEDVVSGPLLTRWPVSSYRTKLVPSICLVCALGGVFLASSFIFC